MKGEQADFEVNTASQLFKRRTHHGDLKTMKEKLVIANCKRRG
jgi:hypothetical protein